jgi:hypothetical protein
VESQPQIHQGDNKLKKLEFGALKKAPHAIREPAKVDALKALLGPEKAVLLPANVKTKEVKFKGWNKVTYEDTLTPEYMDSLQYTNIGVRLGSLSGDLAVIDCDSPEAVGEMLALNPLLKNTLATSGRPERRSFWVRCIGEYPEKIFKAEGWGEWRGDGQSIIDGIHPDTGKPYAIINQSSALEVKFEDIKWPSSLQAKFTGHGAASTSFPHPIPKETKETGQKGPKKQGTKEIDPKGTKETKDQRNSFFSPLLDRDEEADFKLHFANLGYKLVTQPNHLWPAYKQHLENKFRPVPSTRHDTVVSFTLMGFTMFCPELIKEFLQHWYKRTKDQGSWKTQLNEHMQEVQQCVSHLLASYPDMDELRPRFSDFERGTYALLRDETEKAAFRRFRNLGLQLPTAKGRMPNGEFYQARAHLAAFLLCSEKKASGIFARFIDNKILGIVERGNSYSSGNAPKATKYQYLLL